LVQTVGATLADFKKKKENGELNQVVRRFRTRRSVVTQRGGGPVAPEIASCHHKRRKVDCAE
jgi:hypothetical protein